MSDKVQLIKEWVENLKNESPTIPNIGMNALAGFQLACDDVIAFIDSLPEEPVSEDRINECLNWDKDWGCSTSPMNNCDSCPQAKWVEVKEEKENYNERYKRIAQTEQFKKSYCDKSLGKEESENEDLEEEIEKIWTNCATTWVPSLSGESSLLEEIGHYELNLSKSDFKGIARHFAEWGKNHQKQQISEDLEEEITKCYKSRNDLMMTRKQFGELIHHFTEWQRNHIMKDAVDATILDVDAQTIEFGLWPEKLLDIKEGDKVKLIICKNE